LSKRKRKKTKKKKTKSIVLSFGENIKMELFPVPDDKGDPEEIILPPAPKGWRSRKKKK